MGKLPKKRTRILAELQAYGEHLGKLKAESHFKETTKGYWESVRGHIGKFIDSMGKQIDPLELAAVVATSYLVHDFLQMADDIIEKLSKLPAIQGIAKDIAQDPVTFTLKLLFGGPIGVWFSEQPPPTPTPPPSTIGPPPYDPYGSGGHVVGEEEWKKRQAEKAAMEAAQRDLQIRLWIMSFLIGFVAVRFGPAIIQSLGGVAKLANIFMGAVA